MFLLYYLIEICQYIDLYFYNTIIIYINFKKMKILIDDVYRLAKGKASRKKIGSRAIPARLNKYEWKEFEIAQKKGF